MQTDPPESAIRPLVVPSAGQSQADAALAALDQIATRYCRELRRVLPFLARQRARVVAGTAAAAHDAAVLPAPLGPGFWVRLEAPERAWAALLFDGPAVLALVEGLFRASSEAADDDGSYPGEDADRPSLGETLTLAQKALLNRLSTDVAAPLVSLAEHYCQQRLAVVERSSLRRGELPELPPDAMAIDCLVDDVPHPWSIRLFMGGSSIRTGARKERGDAASVEFDMASAAVRIPVNVVAELGRLTLKLSQVLGLRCGDTLRLPAAANDPVIVRVEGVPKFDAVPVISRGQVAVKIQARHSE